MLKGTAESYTTFTRTWWRWEYRASEVSVLNKTGRVRVPGAGPRRYHGHNLTYEEARAMCQRWNSTHNPGPLSRKMEFERE